MDSYHTVHFPGLLPSELNGLISWGLCHQHHFLLPRPSLTLPSLTLPSSDPVVWDHVLRHSRSLLLAKGDHGLQQRDPYGTGHHSYCYFLPHHAGMALTSSSSSSSSSTYSSSFSFT